MEALPTGADHELADAGDGVEGSVRVLEREPLVVVVVADQQDVRVVVVESLVEGLDESAAGALVPEVNRG